MLPFVLGVQPGLKQSSWHPAQSFASMDRAVGMTHRSQSWAGMSGNFLPITHPQHDCNQPSLGPPLGNGEFTGQEWSG